MHNDHCLSAAALGPVKLSKLRKTQTTQEDPGTVFPSRSLSHLPRNPFYFVSIFSKVVACVTSCVTSGLKLNLMMSFRNEDMHLGKQKIWAQKLQIGFSFVFYSVCWTKQTDHYMNAIGDSMSGCCWRYIWLWSWIEEKIILSNNFRQK